jgi:arylsulfatase A-like enzyme
MSRHGWATEWSIAFVALPLALAGCGADCTPPAGPVRPNVVLVTIDTLRADHLGCYGSQTVQTPHLDRLAREGVLFERAWAQTHLTAPSHLTILSSLPLAMHGVTDNDVAPTRPVEVLPDVFARAGYRTAAFVGAKHMGPEGPLGSVLRGFEVIRAPRRTSVPKRAEETNREVFRWLRGACGEPFFLWVHYWDPHDLAKLPPGLSARDARKAKLPEGVQPFYAEEVTYMDAQIGRLLDALEERGLSDDTLFVVVADHGQGLMDHGWHAHRLLYQEQIRVPLIVRVPGTRQVAAVPELVRTVDIYPTVLDYLEIELPRPVSGRSLRPLIEGRTDEPRTALADQINGYDWNAGDVRKRARDDFLYMAMERDWKLIYRPRHFDESELFHLSEDPREERNLFLARPDEARRLLERLAEAAPWVTGEFEPLAGVAASEDVQRALGELGYTGSPPLETDWAWTCPRHHDERWQERGPCPACGGAPLVIGR